MEVGQTGAEEECSAECTCSAHDDDDHEWEMQVLVVEEADELEDLAIEAAKCDDVVDDEMVRRLAEEFGDLELLHGDID
jgi:hypothetical protein